MSDFHQIMGDLEDWAIDLEDYGKLEDTEVGEYWCGLAAIAEVAKYGDKTFMRQVHAECKAQIEYIRDNCEIKVSTCEYKVTRRELEWKI